MINSSTREPSPTRIDGSARGAARMREFGPARSSAWFWLGLALTFLPISLYRLATDDDPHIAKAAAVMIGLCVLLSWRGLRVLRGDDLVSLSHESLEGPARHAGPLICGSRIKIALSGLARIHEVGWGVWCAESRSGRRLYWTDAHEGHRELLVLLGGALRVSESATRTVVASSGTDLRRTPG